MLRGGAQISNPGKLGKKGAVKFRGLSRRKSLDDVRSQDKKSQEHSPGTQKLKSKGHKRL